MTHALPADAPAPKTPTSSRAGRSRSSGARLGAIFGIVPFTAYLLLFLAIPTVISLFSGLFDGHGRFTPANLTALWDPTVLGAFWASIWLSAVTAAIGVLVGFLLCYALLGFRPGGVVRTIVDAASSMLAQFGGVMLAFAVIATIGLQGFITLWLKGAFHLDLFASGPWLYGMPGLVIAYVYFQVPLMVITFLPALTALRAEWMEATLTLGGTRGVFWRRVGVPLLAPSLLASFLLLFANAFSAYATAAALASQGAPIVPLQIRTALTSETMLGRQGMAGVLALGMIIVMAIVMTTYALVSRKAARWQA
ncbi:MAG: ABC transporter permease subunit [Microbacteriaceae bacterium]|jgi:putative spermidine/putrescine transport system permease protein|nr:ABC transporter permease subunit [Microbacteriaceae bacterium]MCI1206663.1 ABC transporter permease subunit [Microbacteriaceae bacterium]